MKLSSASVKDPRRKVRKLDDPSMKASGGLDHGPWKVRVTW
jgi:hypothetical protein